MSVLPIIALATWTALCFMCGYLTCYRRYAVFTREQTETDTILDLAQLEALDAKDDTIEAKDQTIRVLRGIVYAMADEQQIE